MLLSLFRCVSGVGLDLDFVLKPSQVSMYIFKKNHRYIEQKLCFLPPSLLLYFYLPCLLVFFNLSLLGAIFLLAHPLFTIALSFGTSAGISSWIWAFVNLGKHSEIYYVICPQIFYYSSKTNQLHNQLVWPWKQMHSRPRTNVFLYRIVDCSLSFNFYSGSRESQIQVLCNKQSPNYLRLTQSNRPLCITDILEKSISLTGLFNFQPAKPIRLLYLPPLFMGFSYLFSWESLLKLSLDILGFSSHVLF